MGMCRRGHDSERDRHRHCKQCAREAKRAWRKANPDKESAQGRRYRAKHPDKQRKWREANPDYQQQWRLKNLEKSRALARKYYLASDPDQRREAARKWREENRERHLANYRNWAKANRAWRNQYRKYRNAKLRAATVVRFSQAQLDARMAYWGNKCWMCGGAFEHVDHVKPLAKGGPHMLANLRPACASCNSSKRDNWPVAA